MLDLFEGSSDAGHILGFLERKLQAGLFARDLANGDVRWSAGMFELFGLAPDSIEPTLELFRTFEHPHDRLSPDEWEVRATHGLPFKRDFRIVLSSGRMRWVSAHYEFVLDASGRAVRLLGICVDITADRAAETQMQAAQSRFKSAVLRVAPAVYIADAAGATTDLFGWNSLAGRPDSAGLGLNWIDALHPDDRDATLAAWRKAIENRTFYEHGCRLLQPDETCRRIRATATPSLDEHDRVTQWNGIIVEVTEPHGSTIATGAQIRAARGLLKWSVAELASAASVTVSVIRRIEDSDDEPPRSEAELAALKTALEQAGVEFVFATGQKPGVRPTTVRGQHA